MKVSFWYSFPLIDSCSYPREFSYRGTSRGYYPRIDLPREDVYKSGRMLPLPQPMPSIVSSTSLLEHPRQSICLTPTSSSRRIGAIGDVTPKSIRIYSHPLLEMSRSSREGRILANNMGWVHQDDMASPKNSLFLRHKPFFGLQPCRADERISEN